ncbi:MAG: LytR C-terminal domain-containing protein [Bdellovibrio sp.]|nr:LytR C-terminal domain-containing protein [Methylotenera sp.]
MKTKSSLLMCLLTSSCLVGCTSLNKSAALNNSYQAEQNIKATTNADLIKADRPDQYYEIGRLYQKNGNYSHATIAYQKSLQLDPGYTKSITGLATVYADQKLYIISIPLFEQVTKIEPTAVNYNNLGYAYYLNKQYAEANGVLTRAITLEPSYLQAQKNLELVTSNQSIIAHSDSMQAVDASLKVKPINTVSEDVTLNNQIESIKLSKPTSQPQVVKEGSMSSMLQANSETKVTQTASGIYELNAEHPVVITESIINTVNTPKEMLVALSGGITFKQISAITKLFDLADNVIAPFNVRGSNKFVEIINGNGVKGMARSVASKFNVANMVQTKVADAERFNEMKTHIQYKTAYREDAVNLNHYLLNKPYLVRNDNLPSNVALRLVLGRDLLQRTSKS